MAALQCSASLAGRDAAPLAAGCVGARQPAPARAQPLAFRSLQHAAPSQRCVAVSVAAVDAEVVTTEVADERAEGVAILRGIRGSPFKFRRVLDQIRGRAYEEALMVLEYMPYRACDDITATLISAASNAKDKHGVAKTDLRVVECFADDAGMYKRFQPRSKGRPFPIHVKKSHITIRVAKA